MPAKKSITKQMILDKAIELLIEKGIESLNAREIAKSLNCSTQPLYTSFKNMEELKNEIIIKCQQIYTSFIQSSYQNEETVYMKYLMSYIDFARVYPRIFECLYMRETQITSQMEDFNEMIIRKIMEVSGLSKEKSQTFFITSWIFAHGIATQIITGYIKWDMATVRYFLLEEFKALKLSLEVNK